MKTDGAKLVMDELIKAGVTHVDVSSLARYLHSLADMFHLCLYGPPPDEHVSIRMLYAASATLAEAMRIGAGMSHVSEVELERITVGSRNAAVRLTNMGMN